MKTGLLLQFLINGLIIGTLYGMVAMCFVLVYKASRAVNFAQGEFLLVGAWLCWGLMGSLNVPLWAGFAFDRLGVGIPFYTSAVAVFLTIFLGLGLDQYVKPRAAAAA